VFFDGAPVLSETKYRDLDSDRYGVTLTMRDGWHRLTVKICGDEESPMFALRLADAKGAPDPALEADPDPAHAKEASSVRFHKGDKPAPAVLGGPVPSFEKLTKSEDPAFLEAYARWLVLTSSDDPSENRARDLARRAAQKAPTIPRCLLAGDLAENRNQRALWIDKAEDIVRRGGRGGGHVSVDDRIATLLARAGHTRGGANWRDAIPYYEQVLALDPDNVAASLGHVELFSSATTTRPSSRIASSSRSHSATPRWQRDGSSGWSRPTRTAVGRSPPQPRPTSRSVTGRRRSRPVAPRSTSPPTT
jgi:hypothetical protein